MTQKLTDEIARLEARIAHSDPRTKARARFELQRVVETLDRPSPELRVRASTRRAREDDDALEAMFDNLPV